MNTWVWGPEAWRVIHSASGSPAVSRSDFRQLLADLGPALPCKFCRRTWPGFVTSANLPEDNVERAYELHNMVSDKLNQQAWKEKRVPGEPKVLRRLTLACLRTMLRTTMREISTESVWNHLEIFAYGSALSDCAAGKEAFTRYTRTLSRVLRAAGNPCGHAVRVVSEASAEIPEARWTSPRALLIVFAARSACSRSPESMPEFRHCLDRVEGLQAGACKNGTCQ